MSGTVRVNPTTDQLRDKDAPIGIKNDKLKNVCWPGLTYDGDHPDEDVGVEADPDD